jgi:hypothetical protein
MNRFLAIKTLALFSFVVMMFAFCKKETGQKKRAFKASIDTWYRVSPTPPEALVVNGTDFVAFAHFPGGGTGNVTHLGNCTYYFNQLAYTRTGLNVPLGSIAAPLTDVPGYPVTGFPLPLIQAGDFSSLVNAIASLNIPSTTPSGQPINAVFHNKKGDAIFTTAITGSGGTAPVPGTSNVSFNGKGVIVGGSGKFKNAVGEFDYNGYFNTENANDAGYNAEGWIDY